MPKGGRRANSGRKPQAQFATMRDAIQESITSEQWELLAQDLFALACKGNLRAAELLIICRFGGLVPPPKPEQVEQIQFLTYYPGEEFPVNETQLTNQEHERKRLMDQAKAT
jgi:hypothetical protein